MTGKRQLDAVSGGGVKSMGVMGQQNGKRMRLELRDQAGHGGSDIGLPTPSAAAPWGSSPGRVSGPGACPAIEPASIDPADEASWSGSRGEECPLPSRRCRTAGIVQKIVVPFDHRQELASEAGHQALDKPDTGRQVVN